MKRFLLFMEIFMLTLSCSAAVYPTHPNPSSIEQIQNSEARALLLELGRLDPGLALEVGRLPEFQQDITKDEISALVRFIDSLRKASEAEKTNLAHFLQLGFPQVRKYSPPLQAIFWVLEKRADEKILGYSLAELLDKAWDFSDSRWEDFETVSERLNAPQLVNYYEKKRFHYGLRTEHPGDPKSLFQTNVGMCDEITRFTILCLRKGGYRASDFNASKMNTDDYRDHHVALFQGKSGRLYVMDNGRVCQKGVVLLSEYLGRGR